MFRQYDLTNFYRLLHPRPVAVITSSCGDGRVNAMACSWFTPVSEEPPTLLVVVDEASYTAECIMQRGEFAVNILPSELVDRIWIAGSRSGRKVDKVRAMGVNLMKCVKIDTYAISESIGVVEVSKVRTYDVGGSKVFVGDVVAAYVKEGVTNNYGWDLGKVSIPLHGWGRKFYILNKDVKYVYVK